MNFLDCNLFKLVNKKLLTPSMDLKITHLTVRQKLKRKIEFTLSTCLHHNIQINWFYGL